MSPEPFGPALAGVVIAAAGVATTFATNFVSFFGTILVVAHVEKTHSKADSPSRDFERSHPSRRFVTSATPPRFSLCWFGLVSLV
jgi:Transmembrane secretion effector